MLRKYCLINESYGCFKMQIIICIFLGHGGGWGYSAHSVEAIRFSADTDILLGGLGLFGGRGEYTAKIKVSSPFTLLFSVVEDNDFNLIY